MQSQHSSSNSGLFDEQSALQRLLAWSVRLGSDPGRDAIVEKAQRSNPWFTRQHVEQALDAITSYILNSDALELWLSAYRGRPYPASPKSVGLVLAGNIPLVGFHDVLCVLISGHRAQIKLSSKDDVLLLWALDLLGGLYPDMAWQWQFTERLRDCDAVIATGSNNSSRYFQHYFGDKPHLFRSNRRSVAILDGGESPADYQALGRDVFSYFGLGCRNVSQLLIPADLDPAEILHHFESFREVLHQDRYRNNFDYQRTILLLNSIPHLGSDFLSLVESDQLQAPVSVLYYRRYRNEGELEEIIRGWAPEIQVLCRNRPLNKAVWPWGTLSLGQAQCPGPGDYADHVDTLDFLFGLGTETAAALKTSL